ncbi:helix-turn-helix domain-containing protein [Pseudoclavibacter sp. Z016]|uniref:helix-turn-helix domain-containing protein n=1 Tax=Pseudoclavibacter sp. Z016 TaxID=2080581 RepID=UPI000CE9398E|nr:XRE family transcriptional regulator [Pseudoclavibacter sp. Z016]PPF73340.1 XRE family transcriptional regulator [Pseudoclavibacter sp. Z016]
MPADVYTASVLGARIRHYRSLAKLTLDDLAAQLETSPSRISLIENGRREPKPSELPSFARALGVTVEDLVRAEAPNSRAALELELKRAQSSPLFAGLGLPKLRGGKGMPDDTLETLVGLHRELERRAQAASATPEEARIRNTQQRAWMRERNNYLPEIEAVAEERLRQVGHVAGALTHREVHLMVEQLGLEIVYADDLPRSTRSITDLENGRIYLPPESIPGGHGLRSIALQAVAHRILGHTPPDSYADFLRQRLEINYFAAACLIPRTQAVDFLSARKKDRDLAVEDFRDAFGVTHEAAALRMTNLMTEHLGMRVHFLRVGAVGEVYKAYENDDLPLPLDVTGAVEGQIVCRRWGARRATEIEHRTTEFWQYTDTPAGTFWSTIQTGRSAEGAFSITFGVPFDDAKYFRGRDTENRQMSRCPDETCCRRPDPTLAARWSGRAWPSARLHAQILASLPAGRFPGVDDSEIYAYLERHAP